MAGSFCGDIDLIGLNPAVAPCQVGRELFPLTLPPVANPKDTDRQGEGNTRTLDIETRGTSGDSIGLVVMTTIAFALPTLFV